MNMFLETLKKLSKNKFIVAITVLVLAGWYLRYRSMNSQEGAVQYAVAEVEKRTLVSSVSGSGQVIVSDQVDIKPKISGEIVAIYVNQGQSIWAGQLIAVLDSEEAERAVRDAQNSLDEAVRNLDDAKDNYQEVKIDVEDSLETTYEDAYSSVSTVFFKLSDYVKDMKDVVGTNISEKEHIASYRIILGFNSLFIERLISDYEQANDLFNENFTFFRTVFQYDDKGIIYELLSDTIDTVKAISRALESARHLYDAIVLNEYYKQLSMASLVDKMQPKVESDVSSVYSYVRSLQDIKDIIDDIDENSSEDIKNAQLAIESAEDFVVQKEEALSDAKERLSKCNIYAPFSGTISYVNSDIKKGESVSSGTKLAVIITKAKLIEINFNEIDAAKLRTNQKAIIVFDALPDTSMTGKVIEVDVIGVVSQGVVSYGVKVNLDINNDEIKVGMSATADIITDIRQDVLAVPNNAVKFQGDSYYIELVEVEDENLRYELLSNASVVDLPQSPKIQMIEIGLSNDTFTEIISGLIEGNIVVYSVISSNPGGTQNTGFEMRGSGMFR